MSKLLNDYYRRAVFVTNNKDIPNSFKKINGITYYQLNEVIDAARFLAGCLPPVLLYYDEPLFTLERMFSNSLESFYNTCVEKRYIVPIVLTVAKNDVDLAYEYMAKGIINYFFIRPANPKHVYSVVKGLLTTEQSYIDCLKHSIINFIEKQHSIVTEHKTADFNVKENFVLDKLGLKEIDVCHLVVAGFTNKETAKTLKLSENTVKNHLSNIYRKLAVHSRGELRLAFKSILDIHKDAIDA